MSQVKIIRSEANAAATFLEIEIDGERLYIAFHSSAVVENGWEPYDQPNPAAYVPLSKERMHRLATNGGGLLLVSKESH